MIHTRLTIYKTLARLIKEMMEHAKYERITWKHILYAIILNDLKEWEEYIGETNQVMQKLLLSFLQKHTEFCLERWPDNSNSRNVNIPQSNTEIACGEIITPVRKTDKDFIVYMYDTTKSAYTEIICNDKKFTYNMPSTVFDFIVKDTSIQVASAIINTSFNEDITSFLTRTVITYQGVPAVEFQFTTAASLNETITITFQQ